MRDQDAAFIDAGSRHQPITEHEGGRARGWASGEVPTPVFNGDMWNSLWLMGGGRKLVETGGTWRSSDGGKSVTVPKAGVYQIEAWAAIKSYSGEGSILLAVTNAAKGTVYSPTSEFGSVYAYGAAAVGQYMTIHASGMIRCGEGERIGLALQSNQPAYATLKDYRFAATYIRQ